MEWDDIAEVEANLGILIDVELEVHHRLGGHQRAVPECPLCRAHRAPSPVLVRR